GDLLPQGGLLLTGAHQVQPDRATLGGQVSDGVEQVPEALLLHQAAHADHHPVPVDGGPVAEPAQVQAVVDAVHPVGGAAEGALQVGQVVVADRDHAGGVGEAAFERYRVDRLVEDVLGVRGEAVPDAGDRCCHARHGSGHRGEVGVQVDQAVLLDSHGELQGGDGVVCLELEKVAQVRGQAGKDLVCTLQAVPQTLGAHVPAEVAHRCADLAEGLVEASVGRWAQGDDLQVQPG